MSQYLVPQSDADLAWRSIALATAKKPSWLAPPLESQTFAVARSVASEPEIDSTPSLPDESDASAHDDWTDPPAALEQERAVPSAPLYPDLRDEVGRLRDRLDAQQHAFSELRRALLVASEPDLVRLACAIAERVTRRELALDPTIAIGWARDAVDALAGGEPPCLAVARDLAVVLDEPSLRAAIPRLATIEVDPALSSMRCEVRTRMSRVDASVEGRLACIEHELGLGEQ